MAQKLEARCPAAELLDGPPDKGPTIICGVMRKRFDRMDRILHGDERSVALTARDDPSTVAFMCCGQGLPIVGDRDLARRPANYTACDIWRANKLLDWSDPDDQEASMEDIVEGKAPPLPGEVSVEFPEDEHLLTGRRKPI